MEKRSQRKRNNEESQDLGLDLEEELEEVEEIEQDVQEIDGNEENIQEVEDDFDSEFREMPKVRIESDSTNYNVKKQNHSNPVNRNALKWILICVLCVVLGVVAYGGYKVFFGSNDKEQTTQKVDKENKTDNEISKPTVNSDTEGPTFVGFLDRVVVNLNAVDVDFSKYYLAIDNDKQASVTVSGDVNLAAEGEYPVTVTATDASGNETVQNATVQVISEDTMVMIPLELSPMIDGSIPMAVDTKQRVDANVILYYYGEVSQEIKDTLTNLGIDVSSYHLDSYWHPNDLGTIVY